MLLIELEDPIIIKIVTVSDHLADMVKKGKTENFTVDNLLSYFTKYDIMLDKSDLYDMIKKQPLNKVISNIQGDKVVFKGQEEIKPEDDESKKVVKSMADKARK